MMMTMDMDDGCIDSNDEGSFVTSSSDNDEDITFGRESNLESPVGIDTTPVMPPSSKNRRKRIKVFLHLIL